ncbi:MAG: RHS repeat-associated core domain-containing protein [Opitutae bacterium]|nr:RHS repeat-associated core domain-containing protein [Opitutae bacterium]
MLAVRVSKTGGPTDTAARHGQYFFDPYGLNNAANAVFASLNVSDGTATTALPAYLEKTPQALAYDDDGNLTSDGRWLYSYDAENRLTAMQTAPAAYNQGTPRELLQFANDYLGRRVKKVHSNWNGSTWVFDYERRFLCHGWNLIAEIDAASQNILKNYFWGLDLSGTLQGAGGVGGLLMAQEGGTTYLPMFDGNGNVMGMIKASTGSVDAAYEYDAFGNTLRESGPYAASNPFRFATKYADVETGLIQYNTRYYSPSLGRFINRDTIGEQGGLNLYAYVLNNPSNRWDHLGMTPLDSIGTTYGLPKMTITGVNLSWVGTGAGMTAGTTMKGASSWGGGSGHGFSLTALTGAFKRWSDWAASQNKPVTQVSENTFTMNPDGDHDELKVVESDGSVTQYSMDLATREVTLTGSVQDVPINAPNNTGNVGNAIGATARALWKAGNAVYRAGATTAGAVATAGRYAGPALGEAIIRNNDLKLMVGFEAGEGINFAQSFTRDLDFFESSTDMGLGGSAIAYGGIEWEIRACIQTR